MQYGIREDSSYGVPCGFSDDQVTLQSEYGTVLRTGVPEASSSEYGTAVTLTEYTCSTEYGRIPPTEYRAGFPTIRLLFSPSTVRFFGRSTGGFL